jgi:hypothetical protein
LNFSREKWCPLGTTRRSLFAQPDLEEARSLFNFLIKFYLFFSIVLVGQRLSLPLTQSNSRYFYLLQPLLRLFLTAVKMYIIWSPFCLLVGNDHEVEFHEIKIPLFHEIKITIMRSKLDLIMRSKLGLNIWQIWSWGRHFDQEVEIA